MREISSSSSNIMDSTLDSPFVTVMMQVFSLLRIPPSGVTSSLNLCRKYLTPSGWRTALHRQHMQV
jgi:hypothetical protein